jgi:hypothetical protein
MKIIKLIRVQIYMFIKKIVENSKLTNILKYYIYIYYRMIINSNSGDD